MVFDLGDELRNAEVIFFQETFAEEFAIGNFHPAFAVGGADVIEVSRVHAEKPLAFFEEIKHKNWNLESRILYLAKYQIRNTRYQLEIAGDFAEAEVFREAQTRPFPQGEIDEKSEEDDPRKMEDEGGEGVPADEEIADNGDDKRFCGQNEGRAAAFLNLRGDELFRQRNHDEEREDADSRQAGALIHPADDKNNENGQGDDGKRDGDARQIEEAESFQGETRQHADDDDAHENSDAVFYAVRVESQESECDDGRRVDAKGLDADDLAEKGYQRGDDREHKEEEHRLYRHALLDKKRDERMVLHGIKCQNPNYKLQMKF